MHTVKAYGGIEVKLHSFFASALDGGAPFAHPPWEKNHPYSLNKRLGRPQALSVRFGKEKSLLLLPRIEPRMVPLHSLGTVQTTLSWLTIT